MSALGMAIGGVTKGLPRNKKDAKKFFGKGDGKPFSKSAAAKAGWRKNKNGKSHLHNAIRNVGAGVAGVGVRSAIDAIKKRRK